MRGSINNVSHNFAIKRDVKQGCSLSPRLFNAILQLVMQKFQYQIRQLGIDLNIHDQHSSTGSKIDVIRDHDFHKWLGKTIYYTKGSLHCHGIDLRIAAASRAFYAKKHIFCVKHIPIVAHLIYFNSTIF